MKTSRTAATLIAVGLLAASAANAQHHDHGAEAKGEHSHGEAHAMSMESGPSTIRATVSPSSGLKVGEPATLTISLATKDGKPVTHADLNVAHTEKVHLLIVDPSLSDYHHEHPKVGATPGSYTFTITPRKAGEYKLFADLLPTATEKQEYAATTFTVEGAPSSIEKTVNKTTTVDGYKFDLKFEEETFSAGHPHLAWVTVTGPDGKPFHQLEPVMGAFAHVVGFSEDRNEIAHIHPMGKEPETADERGGPKLEFHTDFKTGGYKKLFVQVQIDGKQVFAPFGVEVLPAKAHAAGTTAGTAGAHEHSHDAEVSIPATLDALLTEVDERVDEIDAAIAGGQLAKVHGEAFAARDLIAAIPGKVSGLSDADSKALAASIARTKQQAGLLDKFGDTGDTAQTKAVLAKFKAEITSIKKVVEGKQSAAVLDAGNANCPISGKPVGSMQAGASVTHAGYKVGLCCMGCEGAFNKDPDANLKKALAKSDGHAH